EKAYSGRLPTRPSPASFDAPFMAIPEEKNVTPTAVDDTFDPLEFWLRHKAKILLYGALALLAIILFGIYTYVKRQNDLKAKAAFRQAASLEQYRAVAEKYRDSVVGGNAELR